MPADGGVRMSTAPGGMIAGPLTVGKSADARRYLYHACLAVSDGQSTGRRWPLCQKLKDLAGRPLIVLPSSPNE